MPLRHRVTASRVTASTLLVLCLALLPASVVGAQEAPRVDVEARFMFWGHGNEAPDAAAEPRPSVDLLVRRARLVVQWRVTDRLTAQVQAGQDNLGGQVLTPEESISIKDAYVNYRAADTVQFVAGQFKVPFLRANLESAFNQVLAERGTLASLRPSVQGLRDVGAMVWGNVRRTQYRVALFDGSDQEVPSSSGPRITARIAQNWFSAEPGLGATGSYLGTTRVLQLAAQADFQRSRTDPRDEPALAAESRDYHALALEGFYEQPIGHWAVTTDAAWLEREDDYEAESLTSRQIHGYYGQAALLLPGRGIGRFQVAARREAWRSVRGSTASDITRTTVGGSYLLRGHARKLQADYTVKHEEPEVRNDEFRASLVLVF